LNVKEAFLAFRDKRIDPNQFAVFVFPTLKRVAKLVGYKKGVDPDDLTSELWILTCTKLVDKFDPTLGDIVSFLMGGAYEITQTNGVRNLRAPQKEICISDYEIDLLDNDNFVIETSTSHIGLIDSRIDPNSESAFSDEHRKGKLDEILLRLCDNKKKVPWLSRYISGQANNGSKNMTKSAVPGVRLVARKERPINALPMPAKRPPKAAKLSLDQEELVKIRHQLSYSQDLFAKALNIGVPCLASYEYGRTSGVPENVMEKARGLLNEVGCADAKEYEGIPMNEILAKWAEQLGIPYENDVALSKALTVSPATISRWKNNKTRPPLIGKPGRPGESGKLGLKQLRELVRKFGG
jgi:transcriptional regulator with XRE-family HTH domain